MGTSQNAQFLIYARDFSKRNCHKYKTTKKDIRAWKTFVENTSEKSRDLLASLGFLSTI